MRGWGRKHDQGRLAIFAARAALLLSTLFLFTGGGVAHAQPTFAVAEQHARAGDTIHFSIAGATSRVDYEIEVADKDVLRGSAAGAMIAGEFTMPDLGAGARTVEVEAEMRHSGRMTKAEPRIEYLRPRPAPGRAGAGRAAARTRGDAERGAVPGCSSLHRNCADRCSESHRYPGFAGPYREAPRAPHRC